MLQPRGGDMTRIRGNVNGGQTSGLGNSASHMLASVQRAPKRQLNGSTTELEPAIKQEKLDSGYELAASNQPGTLLGTIVSTSSVRVPYPLSVQRGRPPRSGDARQNRFVSVNGRSNTVLNRPVVLVPQGAVTAPRQSSFPAILPHRPMVAPQAVQMYRAGLTTVSAAASSNAPVIVFVSRSSTTGAGIVRTSIPCTVTSSSSVPFRHPVARVPRTARPNNMQLGSYMTARLTAMFGRSVLDKYVGPPEPPSDIHMPPRTKRICQSCGDEFVTEVGLVDHMSRRSMQILFSCTCKLAKWPRLFYNPCMFESFYRAHCVRPGVHVSRTAAKISTLNLDTPEFCTARSEAQNQETETAVNQSEVVQSSENTHSQPHAALIANSNSNSQDAPAVPTVKEIYVNVEVMPHEQGNKELESSGNVAKATTTAVSKKMNKKHADKPEATAANSGHGIARSELTDDEMLLPRVRDFSFALCHNRTKCPECLVEYTLRRGLRVHFSVNRTKQKLRCVDCTLMLPACSFSAHRRLHENRPPFVCPQCGILFDEAESAAVFKAHVERCCFHLIQSSSGTSVSSCPRCSFNLSEADEAQMAQHIVDAHATIYYKCRSCPKAFVNSSAAERHSENTDHEAQKDVVRKCPLCDAVFKGGTGTEMLAHVTEHRNRPLFHCPFCSVPVSRSAFAEHMRSCHVDKILPPTTCEVCGQPTANIEELFTHVSAKHVDYFGSVMKCLPSSDDKKLTSDVDGESEVQKVTSDVEGESNPRREPGSNSATASITEPTSASESEVQNGTSSSEVYECTRCQMKFSSKHIYKRHQAKHRFLASKKASKKHTDAKSSTDPLQQVPLPREKRCSRCFETFEDAESLNQHVSMVHGSPGWHLCHLCANGFSTSRQLERHMLSQHFGKTEASHPYVCALCAESPENGRTSYTVQGLLTKHLQQAHGVPRTAAANMARAAAPPVPNSDSANETEPVQDSPRCSDNESQPVKRLFVSGESTHYQCSRCDFSAEDRGLFVVHAAEHSPTLAGAVQCKECAASFTVAAALYRHLRIVHRIDCDVDSYLRENGGATRCPTPESSSTDDDLAMPAPKSSCSSRTSSGSRGTESTRSVHKRSTSVKGNDDDDDAPAECTVCYRVFLSKQLLRAHMRTHGIAFIQHTRRKLASTSPVAVASPT